LKRGSLLKKLKQKEHDKTKGAMYKQSELNLMSSRQQILYIMQMSQQQTEWDNKDEITYVNPNERFEEIKFNMVSGR
jgi:hypothetical protein